MSQNADHYQLDWLASFVAVARHGGFSAAGKHLYRAQSRVSTHVAKLEQAIGAKLFDRTAQPPRLSPEGRAVLPLAEAILSRIDALPDAACDATGPVRGEVRIGVYPSVAAYLYPPVVLQLRRSHPGLELILWEGETVALGEALARGDIDFAVRPVLPPVAHNGLSNVALWREPLVAVVNRAHALAGRTTSVWLKQLADHPLITIGEAAPERTQQFETNLAFADAGITPHIAFQTNQPQTLVSLVRHGFGIGVTNSLAMTTANTDGVVLMPIQDAPSERVVALWWREDQPPSRALDAVRAAVTAAPPPRFTLHGR